LILIFFAASLRKEIWAAIISVFYKGDRSRPMNRNDCSSFEGWSDLQGEMKVGFWGEKTTWVDSKKRHLRRGQKLKVVWGPFKGTEGLITLVGTGPKSKFVTVLVKHLEMEGRPPTTAKGYFGTPLFVLPSETEMINSFTNHPADAQVKLSPHEKAEFRHRTACIISAGVWGGSRCLLKNRDRNYRPKLRMYHEIRNGVEVLYVRDEITGWLEGMNEFGIGVVNSALQVVRDEAEKRIVKEIGKKSEDGARILKALEQKTLEEAIEIACNFKTGIKGHSFVSDPHKTVSIEQTKNHECVVKTVPSTKTHVRTNHGFSYDDAGYTDGDDYVSSVYRRDRAKRVLPKVDLPVNLGPALYDKRKDKGEANSMVRNTDNMRTTSQLALDLTKKTAYLHLIPRKVVFEGSVVDLPKGYKPKLSLEVFKYSGDRILPVKVEPVKTASQRVASRYVVARVGDCYDANGSFFMNNSIFPGGNSKMRLVHGEVTGQGKMEGVKFGHCWVEDGNTVIDVSNGRDLRMPKAAYYALGRIGDNMHEYTHAEFIRKLNRFKHWGPWDLKTETGL
jgi:hypothetical protein